ncbi:zinc finger, c2h2 type domain-containing protein [Toxoplasma gondii p89]|uniref:Zinc finger, c2h2 type domain-containing protein n=1 Tax=Toxoplasma gondii p89 TaxID=943119 RepID=A0A086J951_TOXGO|nr:zinc finger, c2h2 type domain-containing protein [Toxoplasma gondii p89]
MDETDNPPNCIRSQETLALPRVYMCQVAGCGARFRKAAHLRRHAAVHTEERPFSCPCCSASFKRDEHLRRHITIRHRGDSRMLPKALGCTEERNSPTSDPHCRNSLNEGLTEHIQNRSVYSTGVSARHVEEDRTRHMPGEQQARPTAEQGVDTVRLPHEACLLSGKRLTNDTEADATAPKCLDESKRLSRESHANSTELSIAGAPCLTDKTRESDARPFVCDKCGKSFTLKQHLRRHEKSHVGRHTCEQCGAVFAKKHQIRWHMLEHVMTDSARRKGRQADARKEVLENPLAAGGAENRHEEDSLSPFMPEKHVPCKADESLQAVGFPCPHKDCDMVFLTRGQLYRHLRRVRERSCDYTCEKCSETFVRFSSLVTHRRVAHPTNVHICETCNKRYSRLSRLREHIRKRHGAEDRCLAEEGYRSDNELRERDIEDSQDCSCPCPHPSCGAFFSTVRPSRSPR